MTEKRITEEDVDVKVDVKVDDTLVCIKRGNKLIFADGREVEIEEEK